MAKVVRPGRFFVSRLLLGEGLKGQQETSDPKLAAFPNGTIVLFRSRVSCLEWWRWALREPYLTYGVSVYSHFFTTLNETRNGTG